MENLKADAIQIVTDLQKAGHIAYFAGGCVRDKLMGLTPTDYDIATTAKPEEVERLFKKTVSVGKQFGVTIVVRNQHHFEVATFREEGDYQDGRHPGRVSFSRPEKDALRRDFTINGMFFDPIQDKVIDYVDGQLDIQKKVIRTIGNPRDRFKEDKLRLLRAARFAVNLGFSITPETKKAIQEMASDIGCVSQERIRDELIKLFTRPRAGDGLYLLSELGLLKVILPEIEAMKGVQQSPEFHPEGDVFVHTAIILNQLKDPSPILAFGALLHDVGKPATQAVKEGKITFYSHEHVGAEMAEKILRRLRFSNHEIDGILSCVVNHMKFAAVQQMRLGKLKQFVTREGFDDELEFHRIDCLSSHGKLDNYQFLKLKLKEFEIENLKPKSLINGHDLKKIGIVSGPLMKTILDEVYVQQLEGKWQNKEEVLEWVQRTYQKKSQG
ncbi:MAG: phosphohydrolase [Candidatus Omnitrophica bacterium CG11_big_fil_rev_8_21_14_0_20_45_26]|uniref:Phosphohydrolase n=1 Tax=Candidatus Abzuiibacterium crystallinum TaxID=1974748 RepID=A0A2H0LS41_9BACT|nr:MAG: phosphohydrolase [Candidatus Omnitrophica bacterium CG11_big_fil_rev_8_21_14_0_20_45_26]PIW65002.1 MAG: phosphohydrolase [Candidatus Omnitrophica bacterium CG12_big_fil_rev_8_21_14_0_65_45_16]